MTGPDVPYATAWATLRAERYRCVVCRRPTRSVFRADDGRLVVACIRHQPRKDTAR